MKTNINITLDAELVAEARAKKVGFSNIFNEYLREFLIIKREEKKDNEAEIERLKMILKTKEIEIEEQKRKNIKAQMNLASKGRIIEI